jgi:hypothetical protein
MSFSSASLQIGKLYFRQKARLHCVQLEDVDLDDNNNNGDFEVSCRKAGGALVLGEEGGGLLVEGGGGFGWGPRGMIVELVKQVHLQNVGAAIFSRRSWWFSQS